MCLFNQGMVSHGTADDQLILETVMKITVILSLVQTEFILAVRTNEAISIVKDFVIFFVFHLHKRYENDCIKTTCQPSVFGSDLVMTFI